MQSRVMTAARYVRTGQSQVIVWSSYFVDSKNCKIYNVLENDTLLLYVWNKLFYLPLTFRAFFLNLDVSDLYINLKLKLDNVLI